MESNFLTNGKNIKYKTLQKFIKIQNDDFFKKISKIQKIQKISKIKKFSKIHEFS